VNHGRVLGVVPARLGSERLDRKPLVSLAGRPLVAWVWDRVSGFSALDACVIATDSSEVVDVCRTAGAAVVLTSIEHASGTERVAEVARMPAYRGYDVVVNVQGDEPFVTETHVRAALEQVRRGWDIGTVATPVRSLDAWFDPAVVKVTRRPDGAALYFSRAPIPFRRAGSPSPKDLASRRYLRHVGVYAFGRDALERWMAAPASDLEHIEKLEQLRALEAGLTIGVGIVSRAEVGVDTPADARRAEARLLEMLTSQTPARE
jgi:3-deoxy-manno-octulosonate cytidylyltransferase (CMP-KDO synthetase)